MEMELKGLLIQLENSEENLTNRRSTEELVRLLPVVVVHAGRIC